MERNDDIKDYLRGSRKGDSAHRLEREALSDPFLYEALEGLTSTPGDPFDGLIRLERQLDDRLRASTKNERKWLYVAASVFVLAISGSLWFLHTKDKTPQGTDFVMAQGQALDRTNKLSETKANLMSEDSISIETESLEMEDTLQPVKLRAPILVEQTRKTMLKKDDLEVVKDESEVLQTKKAVEQNNFVKGIVVDERGEGLSGAIIAVTGTNVKAVTDAHGYFRLILPEGRTHLTFSFIGKNTQEVVVQAGTQVRVKMEDSLQGLEEIAVGRYHSTMKSTVTDSTVIKNGTGGQDTIVSPSDIVEFNRYLANALQYPEADINNGNEGAILVSFVINKKKIPSRIRVKDGFSKASNKEIIRLLSDSPEWKNSLSGIRVYVSVRFTIGKEGEKHGAVLSLVEPWQ